VSRQYVDDDDDADDDEGDSGDGGTIEVVQHARENELREHELVGGADLARHTSLHLDDVVCDTNTFTPKGVSANGLLREAWGRQSGKNEASIPLLVRPSRRSTRFMHLSWSLSTMPSELLICFLNSLISFSASYTRK
jgi:hypothetical protein